MIPPPRAAEPPYPPRHDWPDGFGTRLHAGIDRAVKHLLNLQQPEGYWWGELESNCSIQAEYLLMTHFLGSADLERWRKIVNYLRLKQQPDGGWAIWHGGASDISVTVECYFAMKLAGVPADDPVMAKARRFVLEKGGVEDARVFTKLWLSLFGQWDWRDTPSLSPEWLLLPDRFPFSIYEFASWARATIVPCSVLLTVRPVCAIPAEARIDELYADGRRRGRYSYKKHARFPSVTALFGAVDSLVKFLEPLSMKPLRKVALRRAERWIVQRQEADGSWGGIQPPWIYSLMALKALGYSLDHPVMRKGLNAFEGFAREEGDTWRMDACISPVWDTCLALLALQDAGAGEGVEAGAAARWLLTKQVVNAGGDWQIKGRGTPPGGWPFEFANNTYPDIDDSAMVLVALRKALDTAPSPELTKGLQNALTRGVAWVIGMQSRNGGWGSFDKDNTRGILRLIPFCDFGEVLDPPTEDVTAHVVEALGRLGLDPTFPPLQRGVDFLRATQRDDGSWWGRWGVNFTYGLGCVLPALKSAGEDMRRPYVRRAVRWLTTHQNPDGGWGEVCESYLDDSLPGKGPSTASQTGWAILALLAAGEADSEASTRGVQYLLATQDSSGTWDEQSFTGTGFPGAFMLNYHLYRLYWPLMALGQYRQATANLEGEDVYKA